MNKNAMTSTTRWPFFHSEIFEPVDFFTRKIKLKNRRVWATRTETGTAFLLTSLQSNGVVSKHTLGVSDEAMGAMIHLWKACADDEPAIAIAKDGKK